MAKFKCYAYLCTTVNKRCAGVLAAGYANGYVAIPKEHPLYGKDYQDVNIAIHGGLTFSEKSERVNDWSNKNDMEYLDGELPDGYWVFGFDTLHYTDNIDNRPREWCVAETKRLKQKLEEWR